MTLPIITIKYNASTVHIDGLDIRSAGGEFDYALSACPALSRSYNYATAKGEWSDAGEALTAAELKARVLRKKLCKYCTEAAEAMISK
jgi:hypothetical protein